MLRRCTTRLQRSNIDRSNLKPAPRYAFWLEQPSVSPVPLPTSPEILITQDYEQSMKAIRLHLSQTKKQLDTAMVTYIRKADEAGEAVTILLNSTTGLSGTTAWPRSPTLRHSASTSAPCSVSRCHERPRNLPDHPISCRRAGSPWRE
eukprot:PhM_4_TR2480/c1_g1_i2/m.33889